jgi:hypothetical protein
VHAEFTAEHLLASTAATANCARLSASVSAEPSRRAERRASTAASAWSTARRLAGAAAAMASWCAPPDDSGNSGAPGAGRALGRFPTLRPVERPAPRSTPDLPTATVPTQG